MGRFGLHVLSFWLVALSVAPISHAQEEEIPRVLLMDLKNNGLDENLVKTINSLLTVNMTTFSEFNVMSGNDVKQLVALEMEKQNMGCTDDGSCLAEIAGAMGATLVIFGDAGKIGNVMLINLSLFNAELGRSMSRVSIQAINLDEIPTKMSASLQKLMKPVMPKDTAVAAAPPAPAPAAPVKEAPKKVAKAEPAPAPVAEAPAKEAKPNFLWPMVTAGTGLVLTLGGGALVAPAMGEIQVINAQAAVLETESAENVNWTAVEASQSKLNEAASVFDTGIVMVGVGLVTVTAGMVWGVIEKNRFAEE
ncbi:MAG: hypothetical protein CMH56_00940 [Myxococcales bacterium]|nr:hypothetical protein [Myxococcales bacterium]|tara:strand:+ start:1427 stop:2347 length:921 start_codon:yes stop_codon:yes gene_type:complete